MSQMGDTECRKNLSLGIITVDVHSLMRNYVGNYAAVRLRLARYSRQTSSAVNIYLEEEYEKNRLQIGIKKRL